MMIMRWCSLQTNEHDLQAIMYPIICKYHRLNINNGNKVPVFPGYICNRWQNMIVQPSQTHNHVILPVFNKYHYLSWGPYQNQKTVHSAVAYYKTYRSTTPSPRYVSTKQVIIWLWPQTQFHQHRHAHKWWPIHIFCQYRHTFWH